MRCMAAIDSAPTAMAAASCVRSIDSPVLAHATRSSGGARLAAFNPSSTRRVAGGIFGGTKPHLLKAVRACKSIRPERSLEQGAPGLPSRSPGGTRSAGEYLCIPLLALVPRPWPNPGHNEWSPRSTRREHTMVEHLILVGWGNQRSEPFDELGFAEHECNRSIRPGTFQVEACGPEGSMT